MNTDFIIKAQKKHRTIVAEIVRYLEAEGFVKWYDKPTTDSIEVELRAKEKRPNYLRVIDGGG